MGGVSRQTELTFSITAIITEVFSSLENLAEGNI